MCAAVCMVQLSLTETRAIYSGDGNKKMVKLRHMFVSFCYTIVANMAVWVTVFTWCIELISACCFIIRHQIFNFIHIKQNKNNKFFFYLRLFALLVLREHFYLLITENISNNQNDKIHNLVSFIIYFILWHFAFFSVTEFCVKKKNSFFMMLNSFHFSD